MARFICASIVCFNALPHKSRKSGLLLLWNLFWTLCVYGLAFQSVDVFTTFPSALHNSNVQAREREQSSRNRVIQSSLRNLPKLIKAQAISLHSSRPSSLSVNKSLPKIIFLSTTSASGCHYSSSPASVRLLCLRCWFPLLESVFNTFWLHFYELAGSKTQTLSKLIWEIFLLEFPESRFQFECLQLLH